MSARDLMGLILVIAATTVRAEAPPSPKPAVKINAGVTLTQHLWWTDVAERAALQDESPDFALKPNAFARALYGDIEGAIRIAEQMRSFELPVDGLWKEIGVAAARAGRVEIVQRAIEETQRAYYDVEALEAIGTAQAECGALGAARQTAVRIDEQDRAGRVLVAIVASEARAGRFEAALATAASIADGPRRIRAAIAIADELIKRRDQQGGVHELGAALRLAERFPNPTAHAKALGMIFDKMFMIGAYEEVARTLNACDKDLDVIGIDGLRRLGEARLERGDRDGAAKAIARAVELRDTSGGPRLDLFGFSPDPLSTGLSTRLARSQVRLGDLAGARKTVGAGDIEGLSAIAVEQDRQGDHAGAWQTLETAVLPLVEKSRFPTTWVQFAEAQRAVGHATEAGQSHERARQGILKGDGYILEHRSDAKIVYDLAELAEQQLKADAAAEARRTLALARERAEHLTAGPESARRVGRIGSLSGKAGDGDSARALFDRAVRLAEGDPSTLVQLVGQRLTAGDRPGATSMLEHVCDRIERGASKELIQRYRELIDALVDSGALDEARTILGRAIRATAAQAQPKSPLDAYLDRSRGWEFDRQRLKLALAMVQNGQLDEVGKLAESITSVSDRTEVRGAVVQGEIRAGRLERAERLYEVIRGEVSRGVGGEWGRIKATELLVNGTLPGAIGEAHFRNGQHDRAGTIWGAAIERATIARADESRKVVDVLRTTSAPELAAAGRPEAALDLIASVADPAAANEARKRIVKGLTDKDRAVALRALREALGRNPEIAKADIRDNDLQWILAEHARFGDSAEAERLAGRLAGPNRRIFSLLWLVSWHSKAGDMAAAGRLAELARQTAVAIEDRGVRDKDLCWIARELNAAGRPEAALDLIASVADPAAANEARNRIVQGLTDKDRAVALRALREALRRNPEIAAADARDNDLQWILAEHARFGDPAEAERLVGRLVGPSRRISSLLLLARNHARAGDPAAAERLAGLARQAAATLGETWERPRNLAWVARDLSGLDLRRVAEAAVADTPEGDTKLKALLALSEQQEARGDREAAQRLIVQAASLANGKSYAVGVNELLGTLAPRLAESGDIDGAEKLAWRMRSSEQRIDVLLKLASVCRGLGKSERAGRLLVACWKLVDEAPFDSLGRYEWPDREREWLLRSSLSRTVHKPRAGGADTPAVRPAQPRVLPAEPPDPDDELVRRIVALGRLAHVQSLAGEPAVARGTSARAAEELKRLTQKNFFYEDLVVAVAELRARAGDLEAAIAMALGLERDYGRKAAFTHIVRALLDAKDFSRADQVLQRVSKEDRPGMDAAYAALARGLADEGFFGAATRAARQIVALEDTHSSDDRIQVLRYVAIRQAGRSDFDGAQRTLEIALREAEAIPGAYSRHKALEWVAYGIFKSPFKDLTQGAAEIMLSATTRTVLPALGDPEGVGRILRFDQFEPLARQNLEAAKSARERDPAGYLRAADDLAGLLAEVGRYDEAESLFLEALVLRKVMAGEVSELYAVGLDRLGSVYVRRGDYALAEPRIRKALEIRREALGVEHPRYADSLDGLAGLLLMMGDDDRAEPLYRQSLAIRERSPGIDQDYAATAHNLGLLYERRGSYKESEPFLRRCAELMTPPKDKPTRQYAHALSTLAFLLTRMECFEEAEDCYRRALTNFEATCGADHPLTVRTVSNLGYMFLRKGSFAEAEPLLGQALAARRKSRWRLDVADSLNDLAAVRLGRGDRVGAVEASREALQISRKALDLSATVQSQRQQLAMLAAFRERLDMFLSLTVEPSTPPEETFRALLAWKGEVLSRQRRLRELAREGEAGELRRKLQEVSGQLATLALAEPDSEQRAAWMARRRGADGAKGGARGRARRSGKARRG